MEKNLFPEENSNSKKIIEAAGVLEKTLREKLVNVSKYTEEQKEIIKEHSKGEK